MANVFDTENAPLAEPATIVIGDFVQWREKSIVTDYPPASYSLSYSIRTSENGGFKTDFTATEDADGYLIQLSSATTEGWLPGTYQWQKEIVRTSDNARAILKTGQFVVKSSLDSDDESRSHAQIMVSKIESILAGKADSDVSSYSVAGRSLTRMSFSELISARDYYRAEVKKELAAAGIGGQSSTIRVRFC